MATPLQTVTLVLSGEVPLEDFSQAISNFHNLLKALSSEEWGKGVEWFIDNLEISSTVATAKGLGESERVERIVRAYADVGTALENNRPVPYSSAVQTAANGLRRIIDGRIESITFETAEREIIIRSPSLEKEMMYKATTSKEPIVLGHPTSALGSIEGRVQTLTSRGGLRFTLYDLLNDKAVSCYLQEGYEGIMRDVWGKLADVAGWVTRDPLSGRPLSIMQVSEVVVKPEVLGTYRDARACAPPLTDLSPESAIRRLRDA